MAGPAPGTVAAEPAPGRTGAVAGHRQGLPRSLRAAPTPAASSLLRGSRMIARTVATIRFSVAGSASAPVTPPSGSGAVVRRPVQRAGERAAEHPADHLDDDRLGLPAVADAARRWPGPRRRRGGASPSPRQRPGRPGPGAPRSRVGAVVHRQGRDRRLLAAERALHIGLVPLRPAAHGGQDGLDLPPDRLPDRCPSRRCRRRARAPRPPAARPRCPRCR